MIIFDDCLRIICDTPITPEYLWIPFEPRVVFTLPPCLPPPIKLYQRTTYRRDPNPTLSALTRE